MQEIMGWLHNKLSKIRQARLVGGRLVEVVNLQVFGKLRFSMAVLLYPKEVLQAMDESISDMVRFKLRWRQMVAREVLYTRMGKMGYGLLRAQEVNAQAQVATMIHHVLNAENQEAAVQQWNEWARDLGHANSAAGFVEEHVRWPNKTAEMESDVFSGLVAAAQLVGQ